MLESSVRACPRTAYTIVFRHHVAKPGVCHTSTRLCQAKGLRPQVAGQRLLVGHQRGSRHDEDEGQDEEQAQARPPSECSGHPLEDPATTVGVAWLRDVSGASG